ncbi:MAG: rhodanese-like domain-containing protein [Bacteroidota bacterium]
MQLPYLLPLLLVLVLASCARAQEVPQRLKTGHAPLDKKLAKLVAADDKALSAPEANAMANVLFLDARESEEYAVSHLPDARLLGYDRPDYEVVKNVAKDRPLVVYCTVGYRSERAAAELRQRGFTRVYNLYGSLYAWVLAGLPLENADGNTDALHTYNKKWGTFVPDSLGRKVH